MQERVVLLVLLVFSSGFRLAKANSIACEVAVGASCEPTNGSPGCDGDGDDRIKSHEESDRCWPSARDVADISMAMGSFSITKTVGFCPHEFFNYGNCADEVATNEPSGVHHQVQNLEIGYEPVDVYKYNITVRWTYQDNNPSPVGVKAYRLKVTGGPDIPFPNNCVCINSSLNLREYSFTVDHREQLDPLTANMFTFPYANGVPPDSFQVETSSNTPTTCANFETGLPYDSSTCGLPLYGRPRNVKMEQRGASTVLSWEKPCFKSSGACDLFDHGLSYINPEIYYLTLRDSDNRKHYFRVSNATEVVLNTSTDLHVKVFAYVPCSGLYEYHNSNTGYGNGCSLPGEVGNGDKLDEATCCSFLSPSALPTSTFMFTPTPSPTVSTTRLPSEVYAIVAAIVMGVVLIPILTVVFCVILRRGRRHVIYHHPSIGSIEPSVPVLVVFSPRTPQLETQAIMHSLVKILRDSYGIESHIPELHLPRGNLFDWISDHHEKAHAVFCVCNKYFHEDWNQLVNLENHLKVVYCFKTLFQGHMDWDKYAVVLTDSSDRVYIPPYLKDRRTFRVNDHEGIARFARNIPAVATP